MTSFISVFALISLSGILVFPFYPGWTVFIALGIILESFTKGSKSLFRWLYIIGFVIAVILTKPFPNLIFYVSFIICALELKVLEGLLKRIQVEDFDKPIILTMQIITLICGILGVVFFTKQMYWTALIFGIPGILNSYNTMLYRFQRILSVLIPLFLMLFSIPFTQSLGLSLAISNILYFLHILIPHF